MLRLSLTKAFAALLLAGSVAHAADVYVVHAIDGRDLGFATADLPVDIQVNGGPGLEGVTFGASAGPIGALADVVGDVQITVRLSDDTPDSYTGAIVLDKFVNLALFETAAIVANLDDRGTISLNKFTVDNSALAAGDARVSVAHGAVAPEVDVSLRAVGKNGGARLRSLANGFASTPIVVAEGTYRISVRAAGAKGRPAATFDGVGVAGNVLVVAAGSVAGGTFTLIPVSIQQAP